MHFVIPIFIPHQGCPHLCLFCNQNSITGKDSDKDIDISAIEETISTWLTRTRQNAKVEVAFYGGSFTCLSQSRQEMMLGAVRPFLERGEVHGIRLSTRPDCIDAGICRNLMKHGVATVELGVQSLDDTVLRKSMRGHSAEESRRAVWFLKEAGMNVGVQLMPGLPLETTLSFLRTVRETIMLRPHFVRLYPALVVAQSGLAEMYSQKEYTPMSLNKAIALTGKARDIFAKAGIKIIRMGLQPSQSLEKELIAGPYHPAFGELVQSRSWFKQARKLLAACPQGERREVHISERDLSAFVGPKKVNLKRLEDLGLLENMILVTEKDMERGTMYDVVC